MKLHGLKRPIDPTGYEVWIHEQHDYLRRHGDLHIQIAEATPHPAFLIVHDLSPREDARFPAQPSWEWHKTLDADDHGDGGFIPGPALVLPGGLAGLKILQALSNALYLHFKIEPEASPGAPATKRVEDKERLVRAAREEVAFLRHLLMGSSIVRNPDEIIHLTGTAGLDPDNP